MSVTYLIGSLHSDLHLSRYTTSEVTGLAVRVQTVISLDDGNYPLSLTRANTLRQIHPTISKLNLSNDNVICVQRCVEVRLSAAGSSALQLLLIIDLFWFQSPYKGLLS